MYSALLAAIFLAAASGTTEHNVYGVWLTQAATGHVEIADCGDSTPCGTLIWVDPEEAGSQVDARNPDPDQRSRALVGMKMLWGFEQGKSSWKSGKIYDPETGKTYRSNIKRLDDKTLQVKGCVGPICQTQTWTLVR